MSVHDYTSIDEVEERLGFVAEPEPKTTWTDAHYDVYYRRELTEEELTSKKLCIKIDPYFVNTHWKLNSKEDTGVLFHNLKTIARWGCKNDTEREIRALYNQTKRMAELCGITLEDKM
jgi:hypothetical protein